MRSLLTAAAISLAFTLFLTPAFLRLFRAWGWGQVIRTPENIHNPSHGAKRGTPTMGGTIFIAGTIVGYLVGSFTGNNPPTISGILVLWMMVGFGAVGFIDDYMKLRRQRSLGLEGWPKVIGQVLVTVPFAIVALNFPNSVEQTPASAYISVFRDVPGLWFMALGPIIGWLLYLAWISLIGVASSNSVNVTDGLDGLAAGSGIFVVGAYSLIAFWQVQQVCTNVASAVQSACYGTRDPFDLAIISASFVGALVGFLWWNAPKAKVFMGDVGSMAIGGVVAAMAILTRTELLLVLVAGVYVIASGSVILQRVYFKLTRGKRLFLMSPLHHHLEMRGWSEITIVVRMWIIAGLLAVSGVGFFYVEWLTRA
ncbi:MULTISPECIES: phospho-N-acetylmuramoyl-pentapeptide-transferase [unclassified Microbacterium]|uniref:phospho-N-acetylmuramoyl-pentapeptide- transferase n=1 Tax=unclassified Microbacterium TaxID=2609290 RepID=UPI000D573822|nr:phospho-N-acetylmuramoyl-pentapeptide-transferase [Microbacterium sp. Gd 4-13]PVW03416.1 phospho-N-acetylmuramoyl-pentapeptide-transferase [Microbacterium sp. Gd 4-13]